jgi:RNA polymerase sigma-70 factor, ECF subfamily
MTERERLIMADLAGLANLFEQHRSRLLAMVERRIDPVLALRIAPEEILHEAFLAAARRWAAFRDQPTMTPYPWLYRIVLDALLEAWRRESRACRDPRRNIPWPQQSSVQLGLHLVNPGTSPSEAAIRQEMSERVRLAVELLDEGDQEILWMRHFDQLSFREAGMVLGISENAATVRYARALDRLRSLWSTAEKGDGT